MRLWFYLLIASVFATESMAKETVYLPLESEEVTVNIFSATFREPDKPVLIWFTEGYASRKPFKQLITQLNDVGYDVWQVDLLESYFLQRTPTNVRSLSGEGVAEVLKYAGQQDRVFIPVSTGRMSLVLLRGARLWQLAEDSKVKKLEQLIMFFLNLFDAPKKAGDAPQLFPIVSATSLPITLVQPTEGTYKWKLPEIVSALENNQSQVTIASVPKVRDWYFLRRDPSSLEKQASEEIPTQLEIWRKAGKTSETTVFKPVEKLEIKEATISVKGLVPVLHREAPNFVLSDIHNKILNLKDKRGKVVLLNFWASWCPPCVKEIPSMNRLAESFDSDQFEIVSVNFKESPEKIGEFLKQVQVDFPVLIDLDGKVSAAYEIFAFPSSFILDAKGQLRYSVNAAIEWDEPEVRETIKSLMQ